ncbi:Lrp/AsnC family transcriptional regulator [Cryptosporangium sp. NPDC051539]|uniref:Lrp/AsnC family transcriptional regulator n=1 Tax=Cryptosporangium sp. NPDC051539 TaxID=3363962 RepID=UPI0037B4E1F6
MDEIDRRLLDTLRSSGRETYAELARRVGLSAPAVHDRVGKLESTGVITGYHASVDTTAIGLDVTALIGVLQAESSEQDEIAEALRRLPEVESCWFVAGEESFLLLVRVPDVASLEHTIGRLNRIHGVARTRTTVVLSTKWEGRARPLDDR